MKLEDLSRNERSLLLYCEARAVEHSARMNPRNLNGDDLSILDLWNAVGFVTHGRIVHGDGSLWVRLSPEAQALAAKERAARAARIWAKRTYQGTAEARGEDMPLPIFDEPLPVFDEAKYKALTLDPEEKAVLLVMPTGKDRAKLLGHIHRRPFGLTKFRRVVYRLWAKGFVSCFDCGTYGDPVGWTGRYKAWYRIVRAPSCES